MKTKLLFLSALIVLGGCNLIWGPTATAKKFVSLAEKGDVDGMTALFSRRAIQRDGIEKLKKNNQYFADLAQKASRTGKYATNNIKESIDDNNARVGFHYQNSARNDSIRLVFALTKEDGSWKIDNIGGSELEEIADLASPELKDPPVKKPEPTETAQTLDSSASPESAPPPPSANARGPISGGVLNGKATSLPKPGYPPIARAAKASGTVVVQVTVDENGNVIEAHAISGHPLLQAAAVAAARGAKFSPTKLAGEPVKVNGVINYIFTAE